jgi:hypothetical protein
VNDRIVYFPGSNPTPCPPVLTADEAALLLRISSANPTRTIEYYRSSGMIKGIRVGKNVRYRLDEVLRFAAALEDK